MLWSRFKFFTQSIPKNFGKFWDEDAALIPAEAKGSPLLAILIIAGVLIIVLQAVLSFPQLLVRAPYEEWDEIVSHNATLPMPIESRFRAPTYGTLEDSKFSVAHWIYRTFDPVAKKVPPGLYANSLPSSWQDGWILLGPNFWGQEATIDYNYARGIYDRQPFFYARLINLVLIHVLLLILLAFCVRLFRSAFWLAFLPVLIFTVTPPSLYQLSACLPNNINALLSALIFLLLIEYVILRRHWAFYAAAVLCAAGMNFKIDFALLGLLLAALDGCFCRLRQRMAAVFENSGRWPGFLYRDFAGYQSFACPASWKMVDASNEFCRRAPGRSCGCQGRYHGALRFPAGCGSFPWNSTRFPWHGRRMACRFVDLFSSGVVLVQRHLTPGRKIALLCLSLLPLLVLWGIPILRGNPMYGRYFLNGLSVAVIGFGTGLAVLAWSKGKAGRVLAFAVGVFLAGFYGIHLWKVADNFQQFYGESYNSELGFDMRITRNQAVDFLIKAYHQGGTASTVLLDQHGLFDLRALVKHNIPFRLVNSHNFREILRQTGSEGKPVLALFANAQYEPPALWIRWSPGNEAAYNAYRDFFLRQNASFHVGTRPVSLLLGILPARYRGLCYEDHALVGGGSHRSLNDQTMMLEQIPKFLSAFALKTVSGLGGVLGKHFHSVERQRSQVHAQQLGSLSQNVVLHRHDVAAALLGLKNVEHFAHAGPEQLGLGLAGKNFPARAHYRHGVHTGVGDASGEHRDDRGNARVENGGNGPDLLERENSSDVELHGGFGGQFPNEGYGGLTA